MESEPAVRLQKFAEHNRQSVPGGAAGIRLTPRDIGRPVRDWPDACLEKLWKSSGVVLEIASQGEPRMIQPVCWRAPRTYGTCLHPMECESLLFDQDLVVLQL